MLSPWGEERLNGNGPPWSNFCLIPSVLWTESEWDFCTSVHLSLGHRAQKWHFWGKHLCSVFFDLASKGKEQDYLAFLLAYCR